jgi:hypothetical protein
MVVSVISLVEAAAAFDFISYFPESGALSQVFHRKAIFALLGAVG